MKKSLFIILLIACFSVVRANIASPQAYISEVLVDSIGNWTIEMGFYEWDIEEIDSIWLETSSGNSLITFFTLIPVSGHFDSLAVITNANLSGPVSINPEGDYVKLISYSWGDNPFDYVAFGNFPESQIDCIKEGESVIFLSYVQSAGPAQSFCLDISPTIGSENDTTGALGTYTGMVYNLSGNPFTEGFFDLQDVQNCVIFIQPDGSFTERIFSRRYTIDTINLRLPPWPWTHEIYAIEVIDFCIRPDSSHYEDIITTSLIIGVEEPEKPDENIVTIAPNPFSDIVDFYFNLKNPEDEQDFAIYSLDGKKIIQIRLDDGQRKYQWQPSAEISSGTYIYQLRTKKGVLKTGKFIRL